MCAKEEYFVSRDHEWPKQYVKVGDGKGIRVEGCGKAFLPNVRKVVLNHVLYVPKLCANLVSVYRLYKDQFDVQFDKSGDFAEIYDAQDMLVARFNATESGLYILQNSPCQVDALHVREMSKQELWHRRLGHMYNAGVSRMSAQGMVDGMDKLESGGHTSRPCAVCTMGKHQRKPFPGSTHKRTDPMELVHMDTQGPISKGGLSRYLSAFVDDATHYAVIVLSANKYVIPKIVISVLKMMSVQSKYPLLAIRSDRGTEFINNEVTTYLSSVGAIHQPVPPETKQQNGVAERMNKTLVQKARCIRLDAGLPLFTWGECVKTACLLLNLSACTGRDKTPVELFLGQKPCVADLKVPGCLAYVWLPKAQRDHKFGACSVPAVMLGYEPNTKGYRLLAKKEKGYKVVISRDVVFDEHVKGFPVLQDTRFDPKKAPTWIEDGIFNFAPVHARQDDPTATEQQIAGAEPTETRGVVNTPLATEQQIADAQPTEIRGVVNAGPTGLDIVPAQPDSTERECVMQDQQESGEPVLRITDGNDDGLWNRELRRLLDKPGDLYDTVLQEPRSRQKPDRLTFVAAESRVQAADGTQMQVLALPEGDKPSVSAALSGPNKDAWWDAIQKEYGSLVARGTWVEVRRHSGMNILPCHWVLNVKRHAMGTIERFKARLVVGGNHQREGVDYSEVFAPTSGFPTLRAFLAMVATEDMEMHGLDVEVAFLNGDLVEEVYMHPPKFFAPEDDFVVLRLEKSLYGLKQAPRAWREKLESALTDLGYTESAGDPGLFFRHEGKKRQYVLTFVDDGLLATKQVSEVQSMKDEIKRYFACRDLGEPTSFLSINICRDRAKKQITISQPKLVSEVLTLANMQSARKVTTPLDPSVKYVQEGEPLDTRTYPYNTVLGKLLFISVCTRPDIAHAVNVLTRFMQKPTMMHWKGLMHVCRYLYHSKDWGITYGAGQGIVSYTDAGYANCPTTAKSTSGYVTLVAGGAVDWSSKRQSITAQSSCEAEYIAAAHAVRAVDYMRKVLWSMNMQVVPWSVLCDNDGAIAQTRTINTTDKKMRHVAIKYHLVRDRVNRGEITFSYVPGSENVADCFTKAAKPAEHQMAVKGMGLGP
jgi:hypothetical protein